MPRMMLLREKGHCLEFHWTALFPSFLPCCRATLRNGREVCLEPSAPWVKLIIKAILDKWVISPQWAQLIENRYFNWTTKHRRVWSAPKFCLLGQLLPLCSLIVTNTVIALSLNYSISYWSLTVPYISGKVTFLSLKAEAFWKPAAQVLRESEH